MLLMDLSFSWKRNVSAFQASFFEMLSAWSASFLAGMTRISREMNHRACRERETTEPSTDDAAAVVAESLFSAFQVYLPANRITSLLPTIHELTCFVITRALSVSDLECSRNCLWSAKTRRKIRGRWELSGPRKTKNASRKAN